MCARVWICVQGCGGMNWALSRECVLGAWVICVQECDMCSRAWVICVQGRDMCSGAWVIMCSGAWVICVQGRDRCPKS
jgi:hypothetical protein